MSPLAQSYSLAMTSRVRIEDAIVTLPAPQPSVGPDCRSWELSETEGVHATPRRSCSPPQKASYQHLNGSGYGHCRLKNMSKYLSGESFMERYGRTVYDATMPQGPNICTRLSQTHRCPANVTIFHILLDCTRSWEVWHSNFSLPDPFFSILNLITWIMDNISTVNHLQEWCSHFATTCWKLWTSMNEEIFQEKATSSISLSFSIQAYYQENYRVLQKERARVTHKLTTPTLPDMASSSVVNFLVDGAVCRISGIAACGGVMRDNTGSWLFGFNLRLGICSVECAELWTIYYGAAVACVFNHVNVQFFSNSTAAIRMLEETSDCLPYKSLCSSIRDIMELCSSSACKHISRTFNTEVDCLAKAGLPLSPRHLNIFFTESALDMTSLCSSRVSFPVNQLLNN